MSAKDPITPQDLANIFNSSTKVVSTRDVSLEREGTSPFKALGKYDTGLTPASYEATGMWPEYAQSMMRGQNQTSASKLFNGFLSRTASVALKLASGIVSVGALAASPFTQDMSLMWDNAILDKIHNLDEGLKEALPAHASRHYTEGNWMQKFGTASFWANDGFDGIAFLASAAIPGALFSKIGSVSKALSATKYGKTLGKALSSTSSATGLNTANVMTTAFNTVAEASMEAEEVNRSIRNTLAAKKGFQSYDSIPDDDPAKVEIKEKAGQAATRTFYWNMAALAVPNYIQSRWFTKKPESIYEGLKKMARKGEALPAQTVRSYLLAAGGGLVSEGLWEENIQSAITAFEERLAKGETGPDYVSGPLTQALDNAYFFTRSLASFNNLPTKPGSYEDEASSAIALGAMLGGGMSMVSAYNTQKAKQSGYDAYLKQWEILKSKNKVLSKLLVKNAASPYASKPATGLVNFMDAEGLEYEIDENNKPVFNPQAMFNINMRNAANKKMFLESLSAASNNDPMWASHVKQTALMAYVYGHASNGATREDIEDLIDLDVVVEKNDFVESDFLQKSKQDALQYYDIFQNSIKDSSSIQDLDNPNSGFRYMMARNMFYLQSMIQSLGKLKSQSPEFNAQVKEMISQYESQVDDYKKNLSKYRELYDIEVNRPLQLVSEIRSLKEKLKNKNLTQNEQDTLFQRLIEAAYELSEVQQIYGFEHIEYGDGVSYLESESFKAFQPVTDATKEPNFKSLQYYNYGKSILNVEKALEAFTDPNQSLDSVVSLMESNLPAADPALLATMDNKSIELDDQISSLRDEQAKIEQEIASLEESEADEDLIESLYEDYDSIEQEIQDLTAISNRLRNVKDEIIQKNQDLYNEDQTLKQLDTEEVNARLIDQLITYKLNKIQEFINQNNLNTLPEAENYLRFLNFLESHLPSRSDIKQYVPGLLGAVATLKQQLSDLINRIQQEELNRIKKQEKAAQFHSNNMTNVLSDPGVEPLVPEIKEDLDTLSSTSQTADRAYLALLKIISSIKDKTKLKDKLNSVIDGIGSHLRSVSKLFSFVGNKYVYRNLIKYGPTILLNLDIDPITDALKDPNSIYYKFSKDRDIASFEMELDKLKDSSGVIKGLTPLESKKLIETLQAIKFSLGASSILKFANLKSEDIESIVTYFESLDNKRAPIPSTQQMIAIVEIIANTFTEFDTKNGQANITVLSGVLGSGKTSNVLLHVIELIKRIHKVDLSGIEAFGHSDHSSKVVNTALGKTDTTTLESFLANPIKSSTRFLVIDEVYAISNEKLNEIFSKIQEHKSKTGIGIRIISLGDRSQTMAEKENQGILSSLTYPETKDVSPLSAVYRTSIPAIFSAAMYFRDKINTIDNLLVSSSVSASDALRSNDTSSMFGVLGLNSPDQVVAMANKSSSRSKVVIVNNQAGEALLRKAGLSPNVEVLSYKDAQSRQWDEVYMYLDYNLGRYDNAPFPSPLEFNSALYTSIGRAKFFTVLGNTGIRFNQNVNVNINANVSKLQSDMDFNKQIMKDHTEVYRSLNPVSKSPTQAPSIPSPVSPAQQPPTPQTSTAPEQQPPALPESDDEIIEDDPIHDEEPGSLPEQDSNLDESLPKPQEDKISDQKATLNLSYPSSYVRLKSTSTLPADVDLTAPVTVVAVASTNQYGVEYWVFAKSVKDPNKKVFIAMLGAEDLVPENRILSSINQNIPKVSSVKLTKSARGVDATLLDKHTVLKGKINEKATNDLTYVYEPFSENSKAAASLDTSIIDSIMYKWIVGFFDKAKGGKGIAYPYNFFDTNQNLNWKVLSKYVTAKIFSKKDLKALPPSSNFTPAVGVPYLVINMPGIAPQYIRLEPKAWGKQDRYYDTLQAGTTAIKEIESAVGTEEAKLGNSNFNKLLDGFLRQFYKAELVNGKPVLADKASNVSTVEWLRTNNRLDLSRKSDQELMQIANSIAKSAEHLLGFEYDRTVVSEAEAKTLVDSGQFKNYLKLSDNRFALIDEDGNLDMSWRISTATSPMQRGINALSLANHSINGVNIRSIKQVKNSKTEFSEQKSVGKSILASTDSSGVFYNKLRGFMRDALESNNIDISNVSSTRDLVKLMDDQLSRINPTEYQEFLLKVEEIKKAFYTERLNTESLSRLLEINPQTGTTSGRNQIQRTSTSNYKGFNETGSNLDNPQNRSEINIQVTSLFTGVIPTQLVVEFDIDTASAPEQQPPVQAKKFPASYKGSTTEKVGDPNKEISMTEVLQTVYESADDFHKVLIQQILASPHFRGVRTFLTKDGTHRFAGFYELNTDTIILNGGYFEFDSNGKITRLDAFKREALIHEALHSITSRALNAAEGKLTGVQPTQRDIDFHKRITDLFNIFMRRLKADGITVESVFRSSTNEAGQKVVDIYEFIANLSNPAFKAYASKIEVKKSQTTLLKSIVDAILDFLGLSESNVYDSLFKIVADFTSNLPSSPEQVIAAEYEEILKEVMKRGTIYEDYHDQFEEIEKSEASIKEKTEQIKALKEEIEDIESGNINFVDIPNWQIANYSSVSPTRQAEIIKAVFGTELNPGPWANMFFSMFSPSSIHKKSAIELVNIIAAVYNTPSSFISRAYKSSKLFKIIWDRGLKEDDKIRYGLALSRVIPGVGNMSKAQVRDILAEVYASGINPGSAVLKTLFDRITTIVKNTSENKDSIEDYIDSTLFELGFEAGSNQAATESFITSNFGNSSIFAAARLYVLDHLHAYSRSVDSNGLPYTREQIVENLNTRAQEQLNSLRIRENISDQDALQIQILESLLKPTEGGLNAMYHIVATVYPTWAATSADELSRSIGNETSEYRDKTEGILDHTEDSSHIDNYSRSSDNVKEFLSLILNPSYVEGTSKPLSKYLSSRLTYTLLIDLLKTFFDLEMTYSDWDSNLERLLSKNVLSSSEIAVVERLTQLKQEADTSDLPPNIRFYVLSNKFGASSMGVIYDSNGTLDLDKYSFEYLSEVEGVYAQKFSLGNKAMFDKLFSELPPSVGMTPELFTTLHRQATASDVLSNLSISASSLTTRSYKYVLIAQNYGYYSSAYNSHTGFGVEQAVSAELRLAVTLYHYDKGLSHLANNPKFQEIVQLASKRNPKAVTELLSLLGLSDISSKIDIPRTSTIYNDIIGFKNRISVAEVRKEDFDVVEFLSSETSLFSSLAQILKRNNALLRESVIIDSNGNRIYRNTASSFTYSVLDYLVGKTLGSLPLVNGDKYKKPKHLSTEYYEHNHLLNGISNILARFEHDAIKYENSDYGTAFTNETDKTHLYRVVVASFLDQLSKTSNGTYQQFIYQPADRPRVVGVTLPVMSREKSIEAMISTFRLYSSRDNDFIRLFNDKHKNSSFLNFSALSTYISHYAMKNGLSVDQALKIVLDPKAGTATHKVHAEGVISIIEQETATLINDLVQSQVQIPSDISKIASNILSNNSLSSDPALKQWAEQYVNNEPIPNKVDKKYNEQAWQMYEPLLNYFVINNYINSRALNELLLGPMDFYKNEDDIVKRISGVLATGVRGYIDRNTGPVRVAVLKDTSISKESQMRNFFRSLVESEAEVNELLQFFSSFDTTDAQGFMLPGRQAQLSKQLGSSYRLGNVLKPVFFSVETVNGHPVPRYIKYSSTVLSDDLIRRFPALARVREYLETNRIDEAVFGSAWKVGKPASKAELIDLKEDEFKAPSPLSVIELDPSGFKMQFNPLSSPESHVSLFTQLTYFLNIGENNKINAQTLYSSLAKLISIGQSKIKDRSTKELVKNALTGSASGQVTLDLINEGLSLNNPLIADRIVTYLSAAFERNTIKPKFRGAKLVQQTDEFITKGGENGITLHPKHKPGERLQFVTNNDRYYAEVILPASFLTEEMRIALERGDDLFLFADYFGYRIPTSELHSAVPMKVVGSYDDRNTNVIIAPAELVYILGSDFDVDSLFITNRSILTDIEKQFLGTNIDFAGYKKENGKYVINSDFESVIERILARKVSQLVYYDEKIANKERKALEKLSNQILEKYYKNVIIESVLEATTSITNRKRMLSPIALSEFNDLNNPNSIASHLNNLGVWQQDLTKDLSYPTNNMKAAATVRSGTTLTGAYANVIKFFAWIQKAGPNNEVAPLKKDFKFKFKSKDVILDIDSPSQVDRSTRVSTWLYLDALVNLAIDNIKNQTLFRLGINNVNGSTYAILIALGMPVKDVATLFHTPLIKAFKNSTQSSFLKDIDKKIKSMEEVDAKLKTSEYVLSDFDIANLLKSKYPTPEAEYAALKIFQRAAIIADKSRTLSDVLDLLRVFPSNIEDVEKMYSKMKEVFTVASLRNILSGEGEIELVPSFPFQADNLLDSENIKKSLQSFLILYDKIKTDIYIHGYQSDKLSKSLDLNLSSFEELSNIEIKKFISKYFISETVKNILSATSPHTLGGRVTTGVNALALDLSSKLRAIKSLNRQLSAQDPSFANPFIDNLVIDFPYRNNARIRLADGSQTEAMDRLNLKQGFRALAFYEITINEDGRYEASQSAVQTDSGTQLQKQIIAYSALSEGFRPSLHSMLSGVPYDYYKQEDRYYSNLLISLDDSMILQVKEDIELMIHILNIKNVNLLDFNTFEFSTDSSQTLKYGSKYRGMEDGIFYDRKIVVPTNIDGTYNQPPKYFVNKFTDPDTGKTSYTLFTRVNDVNHFIAYYQVVTSDTYHNSYHVDMSKPLSIIENFKPSYPRVFMSNNSVDQFTSKMVFNEGDKILLVNYNDPSRKETRLVEVVSKEQADDQFSYTVRTTKESNINFMDINNPADYDNIIMSLIEAQIIEKNCK